MEELQESLEGHGDGGAAVDALSDLFKSGLSVPESVLECLVRVPRGEDELEGRRGCVGRLPSTTTSFPWMFSCWAAWDRA